MPKPTSPTPAPLASYVLHVRNLWIQWHRDLNFDDRRAWKEFVAERVAECDAIIRECGNDPFDGAPLFVEPTR